jgi:hypothetical protein
MYLKTNLLLLFVVYQTICHGQYCTNVGPTSTIDSNVESVGLNGVSGSINYTGCPGVIGLQDLTALSATLNAGSSYNAAIDFGTCGGNYAGVGQAWIDFDQSNTFDPWESIGTWQGTPPTAMSNFTFLVPSGAINGTTRMRIVQREGGSLPLNPCDIFTWGSVMDFGIIVQNGLDCSGTEGDNLATAISVNTLPYTHSGNTSVCYTNQNAVYASPDVYYILYPNPLQQSITVSLCGSLFDTFLSVIDANGNSVAFNDDGADCGTASALTFPTEGLGMVYVIVEGWGSYAGEYTLNIDASYLNTPELAGNSKRIYPNPVSGAFQVVGITGSIRLLDIQGNCLVNETSYFGQEIDVSRLQTGVYLVNYESNGENITEKLFIYH